MWIVWDYFIMINCKIWDEMDKGSMNAPQGL